MGADASYITFPLEGTEEGDRMYKVGESNVLS